MAATVVREYILPMFAEANRDVTSSHTLLGKQISRKPSKTEKSVSGTEQDQLTFANTMKSPRDTSVLQKLKLSEVLGN